MFRSTCFKTRERREFHLGVEADERGHVRHSFDTAAGQRSIDKPVLAVQVVPTG
ncbi:hypothetical protein ABT174_00305 [Streptomyces sparsogenes]|uniref:hypothetical protein n=1 Tax=Streptomyces sparsogenes TaxID=67365 RepID=UPI003330CEC6